MTEQEKTPWTLPFKHTTDFTEQSVLNQATDNTLGESDKIEEVDSSQNTAEAKKHGVQMYAEELSSIQERHPDWPKFDILFYFSPHGSKADFEGMRPYLRAADIVLYEAIGSTDYTRQSVQGVSTAAPYPKELLLAKGKVGDEPIQGSTWEVLLDEIYNSQKIVDTIDLHDTEEEVKLKDEILQDHSLPKADTLDAALVLLRENFAHSATLQHEREAIMVDRFEERMGQILEAHPELKEKPNVQIVISMGSYHTQLRHALRAKGAPSARKFSSSPYLYSYSTEAQRTLAYGKEPSKTLLEKAYAERIVNTVVNKALATPGVPYDTFALYVRSVVSRLNPEQIQAIYTLYKEDELGSIDSIDRFLQTAKIDKLPQSLEELTSLVQNDRQKKRQIGQRAVQGLGIQQTAAE